MLQFGPTLSKITNKDGLALTPSNWVNLCHIAL